MFTAKEIPTSLIDPEGALMEANLNMLALEAELAAPRTRGNTLESDNRNSTEENTRFEIRVEDLEEGVRRHIDVWPRRRHTQNIPWNPNKPAIDESSIVLSASSTPFYAHPIPSSVFGSKFALTPNDFEEDDAVFAICIQLESQEHIEPIVEIISEKQQLQYEDAPEFETVLQRLSRPFVPDIRILTGRVV